MCAKNLHINLDILKYNQMMHKLFLCHNRGDKCNESVSSSNKRRMQKGMTLLMHFLYKWMTRTHNCRIKFGIQMVLKLFEKIFVRY